MCSALDVQRARAKRTGAKRHGPCNSPGSFATLAAIPGALHPRRQPALFLRGTDAIKQIRIADGPLATHCNVQFRADGKSQRARGRRLVRQCSRCPYSATSKLCRWHQNPSTCKASALQPPAQRARRPDPHMDDRNGPAVRCGPRSVRRFREWGLGWG